MPGHLTLGAIELRETAVIELAACVKGAREAFEEECRMCNGHPTSATRDYWGTYLIHLQRLRYQVNETIEALNREFPSLVRK